MNVNFARSRKLRGGLAAAGAVALLVAMPMMDSKVGAQTLPLPAPTESNPNGLDVVVGETVAITVDQNGNPTPFSLYMLNGQVSGNGSGTLELPVAQDSTSPKDLTSATGAVSNFMQVVGTFGGQMPLTTKTELKVNGETIDPTQGFNLNGDVEITYTVTNNTSRQQAVTYQDMFGVEQTKVVDVPVPFGDSYSVTFGDGWDITDPGAGTQTTTGSGTQIANTFVLFPIVEGVVGGTTQSLTVKGKAQNASLPNTTHTIVPVKLADYFDGVALQLDTLVDNKLLGPLDNVLTGAVSEVVLAANIISGYAGGFSRLSTDYINPLVADVNAIKADPTAINNTLTKLAEGLVDLGVVLDTNAEAKDDIAALLTGLSKVVGKDLEDTVEWLGQLVNEAGPQAKEAADGLRSLAKILDETDPAVLGPANDTMTEVCDAVSPSVDYYGPVSSFLGGNPGIGSSALAAGIKTVSGANKTSLTSLQNALNSQANASLIMNSTTVWGQIDGLPIPAEAKTILKGAACTPVTELAEGIVLIADLAPTLEQAALELDLFAEVAASDEAKKVYNDVLGALTDISGLLSNAECTDADILDPIIAAIEKYGISGLEANAEEIVKEIFSKCGLAQVMTFFGDLDRALATILTDLGDIVENAEKDIPKITNGIKKVQSLATLAGKAFAAIPVLGGEVGDAVTKAAGGVEGEGEAALAEISGYAGLLEATLKAMNDRGVNGDGAPFGNAFLSNASDGNVKNYTAYQITVEPAAPIRQWWITGVVLAVVFLALAVGLGTFLYRRRINP